MPYAEHGWAYGRRSASSPATTASLAYGTPWPRPGAFGVGDMTEHDIVHALTSTRRVDVYLNVVAYNTCAFMWEADILMARPSRFMEEFEIKVSVADFRHDLAKAEKHLVLQHGRAVKRLRTSPYDWDWPGALPIPIKRFWYVVPAEIVERCSAYLPSYAGLISVASRSGDRGFEVVNITPAPRLPNVRKATDDEVACLYRSMYYKAWRSGSIVWRRRRAAYVQLQLPGLD